MPKTKHTSYDAEQPSKVSRLSDKEVKDLESIVFGEGTKILDDDNTPNSSDNEDDTGIETSFSKNPAWEDLDGVDSTFETIAEKQGRRNDVRGGESQFSQVQQNRFQDVHGTPKWAKLCDKTVPNNLLQRSGALLKKSTTLQKGVVEIKRVNHLNGKTHIEGSIIKSVNFHPKSTVAMVAGLSGVVSLFQVDGKENNKLQTIQFDKFPIHCASFSKQGEEIIIGSHFCNYYYSHDLMSGKSLRLFMSEAVELHHMKRFVVSPDNSIIAVCGKFGFIYFIASASKEFIGSLKANSEVTALEFSSDSTILYSHTIDGEVFVWDVKGRVLLYKFYDDGCLSGSALALAPSNQFLACGSSSGIVNIYDVDKLAMNRSTPVKIIDNLTTPVSHLKFNHSSEILSMASSEKDNAVKLVHFPSMTVYKNFPGLHSNYYRVQYVDFSLNSGYYSIANNRGTAYLFRLKYYGNY